MIRWPWTNMQSLNLDWLVQKVRYLLDRYENFNAVVTASAVEGSPTSVNVIGDLDTGLEFRFTLEKGDKGDTGATGATGEQGPMGYSFRILDMYADLTALTYAVPDPEEGDCYAVGTASSYTCYIWNGTRWVDIGSPFGASLAFTASVYQVSADGLFGTITTTTITQLTLTDMDTAVTSDFTLSSNAVTINFDGQILVSGACYIETTDDVPGSNHPYYAGTYILQNDVEVNSAVIPLGQTAPFFGLIDTTPKVIDVQNGDVIKLGARCFGGANPRIKIEGKRWLTLQKVN